MSSDVDFTVQQPEAKELQSPLNDPLLSDAVWHVIDAVKAINRKVEESSQLQAQFRKASLREAFLFLARQSAFTREGVDSRTGRNLQETYVNPPRVENKAGDCPEEIRDLMWYIEDISKFDPTNPAQLRSTQDLSAIAMGTLTNMRNLFSDVKKRGPRPLVLTQVGAADTASESGTNRPSDDEQFFKDVRRELFAERFNLHYVDEKGRDVQLLEFNLASEQNHRVVLKSVRNLINFAVRNSRLVPYESIASQLAIKYPNLTDEQKKTFIETALKWIQSSLPAGPLVRAAEEIQASGVTDQQLKPFVEILTVLVRNKIDPNVPSQLSTLLSQAKLAPQDIPALVDVARDVAKSQANLPVLLNLTRVVASGSIKPDELFDASSRAEVRLRQERQIKDLEGQLEAEKKHSQMLNEYQQALDRLNDQDKKEAEAAILVLRDRNFLSRISLFRDIAIWMSQQSSPIKSPDELWALIQQYSRIKNELALLQNQNNISADLRDLLRLLDDQLLQPKPTLQLLRSLLNDPETASLGAVADTIRKLKGRNSELSLSFRRTLAAMGSLLQVFSNVSREYALRVGEFVQSFSDKVAETTRGWGLPVDNPVAQFAAQLTIELSNRYYVKVQVGQDVKAQTLELTFNGQGLDLTTDAVFLQAASLLKWLDRFIVDPQRPADPGMAKLWNDASEALFDWQKSVIDAFVKTDVAGPAGPIQTILGQVDAATRTLLPNMNQAMGKVGEMIRGAIDRFGRDLKAQDALLRQRVEYLLVNPALGQYALTVNGQDAKTQEAARTIFRSFIDATRLRLLENQTDEAKSVEVMAEIDKLANDMRQLKLESGVKDSENKRLEQDNKELDNKYKVIKQANDAYDKKIRDAESSLIAYATKTGVTLKPGLDEDIKRLLDFYEDTRQEFIKTRGLVSALANKYQVSVPGGAVLLSAEMKAVLDLFAAKYDNWTAASQKLRALSAGKLFPGGHQPTSDLEKDVEVVLNAFRQTQIDWEKVEKLVSNYSLLVFEGKVNATGVLEIDTKAALDAYERYRQDFIALRDEENKWWTTVQDARFPSTRNMTEDELVERKSANTLLSGTTGVLPLLAQRRNIVAGWVGTLAKIIEENDRWNVKDLIQKAQGKSSGSSSSSAAKPAVTASANPYYRVQFNGEVDTLTKDHVFPVFLRQTPFMRLWMFAREFAGAASNQLGNILEPLAPGLEIDDERTLFILRQYQTDSKGNDKDNPTLPTGASRTEVARQELAAEDKKDLKETAEERLKIQKATAFDYIKQLDNYNTLDEYETKVRQYFKNIALTAVVHCQELLQRTDLPEFRRITLAELINSPNLCSGFARLCGLYVLVKQGTVPGMISTQSSASSRVLEFDEHARQLPRMYRRKGPYVWEVIRVPPSSSFNTSTATSKRVRL